MLNLEPPTLAEQLHRTAFRESSSSGKAGKLIVELTSGDKFNNIYKAIVRELIDYSNIGQFSKKFYDSNIKGLVYSQINYDQFILLSENDYNTIRDAIKSALEEDGFKVEVFSCQDDPSWSLTVSW